MSDGQADGSSLLSVRDRIKALDQKDGGSKGSIVIRDLQDSADDFSSQDAVNVGWNVSDPATCKVVPQQDDLAASQKRGEVLQGGLQGDMMGASAEQVAGAKLEVVEMFEIIDDFKSVDMRDTSGGMRPPVHCASQLPKVMTSSSQSWKPVFPVVVTAGLGEQGKPNKIKAISDGIDSTCDKPDIFSAAKSGDGDGWGGAEGVSKTDVEPGIFDNSQGRTAKKEQILSKMMDELGTATQLILKRLQEEAKSPGEYELSADVSEPKNGIGSDGSVGIGGSGDGASSYVHQRVDDAVVSDGDKQTFERGSDGQAAAPTMVFSPTGDVISGWVDFGSSPSESITWPEGKASADCSPTFLSSSAIQSQFAEAGLAQFPLDIDVVASLDPNLRPPQKPGRAPPLPPPSSPPRPDYNPFPLDDGKVHSPASDLCAVQNLAMMAGSHRNAPPSRPPPPPPPPRQVLPPSSTDTRPAAPSSAPLPGGRFSAAPSQTRPMSLGNAAGVSHPFDAGGKCDAGASRESVAPQERGEKNITIENLIAIGVTDPVEQAKILGLPIPQRPPPPSDAPPATLTLYSLATHVAASHVSRGDAGRISGGSVPTAEQLMAIGITDPAEQAEIISFSCSQMGQGGGGGIEGMIQRATVQQQRSVIKQAAAPAAPGMDAIQQTIFGMSQDNLENRVDVDLTSPVSWGSYKSAFTGAFEGREVSVLLFRGSNRDMAIIHAARDEMEILRSLPRHQHIIQYFGGIFRPHKGICIVLERCPYGQLDLFCREHEKKMRVSHRVAVLSQICDAMRHVSAAGITHRDLSAHNILVHSLSPLLVKVIDFGLSVRTSGASGVAHACTADEVFSTRWTAIEIFSCPQGRPLPWSEKSDVWSFGITAWQIWAHGEVPYTLTMTDAAVMNHVTKGRTLGMVHGCPVEIHTGIMMPCWRSDPAMRPSFNELWDSLRALHKKYMIVTL